jgi:predicted transcriptional regulator with HTH domain
MSSTDCQKGIQKNVKKCIDSLDHWYGEFLLALVKLETVSITINNNNKPYKVKINDIKLGIKTGWSHLNEDLHIINLRNARKALEDSIKLAEKNILYIKDSSTKLNRINFSDQILILAQNIANYNTYLDEINNFEKTDVNSLKVKIYLNTMESIPDSKSSDKIQVSFEPNIGFLEGTKWNYQANKATLTAIFKPEEKSWFSWGDNKEKGKEE